MESWCGRLLVVGNANWICHKVQQSLTLCRRPNTFFPNGKSRKGNLQDCVKVELTDFKGDILPDDMSVAECYDLYKIGILTFYLSTCTSSDNITHSGANTMPERNTSGSEPGESIQDVDPHNQVDTFPPVTLSGAAVTSVSPRSTQL